MLKKTLSTYAPMLFAGALYAAALKYFVLPSRVILTGMEGVATAISYYFDDYTLFIILYLLFQLILLVVAWLKVSRHFALRSVAVVGTVILGLALLPDLQFAQPEPQNERIILVLFGGILAGAAKALAFTYGGSTGDEDILSAYVAMKYLKPVGSIAIIAGSLSTAFGLGMDFLKNGQFESVINTLMYTSIYIFASAETLNTLYKKFKITMLVVITRRRLEVGQAIASTSTHRTYTSNDAVGGRSQDAFSIVRTILTQEELPDMLAAVEQVDPECFYYHHDIEGVSRRYYIEPIGASSR